MMYRQRTFAVKIAIGKTADLIKSSARMDVASQWERKAFAALNLELLFCLSTASHQSTRETRSLSTPGREVLSQCTNSMTVSQNAINVIAALLFFSFFFVCLLLHGSTCCYLPPINSQQNELVQVLYIENTSIVQNKLQIKHIH